MVYKINPLEPKRFPTWDIEDAFWTPQDVYGRNFVTFEGDGFNSAYVQMILPILEMNYYDRLRSDEKWQKNGEWKHVGRIPYSVYLEWQKLGITEDSKALLKALELNKEFKATEKRL